MRAPLGILGGIFDPVHNGHLAVACLARDHFKLDKVYLIPSGTPPHKSGTVSAPASHRLAMLRRAVRAVKGSKGLLVWDGEIRRKGVSYTVDTIRRIKEKHRGAPLYFIIGSDNLREISTWHEYRKILEWVILCVTHRPRYPMTIPKELRGGTIKTFPSPGCRVSSTMIRRRLGKGISCDRLLPPGVAEYIRRHKLYSKVIS